MDIATNLNKSDSLEYNSNPPEEPSLQTILSQQANTQDHYSQFNNPASEYQDKLISGVNLHLETYYEIIRCNSHGTYGPGFKAQDLSAIDKKPSFIRIEK